MGARAWEWDRGMRSRAGTEVRGSRVRAWRHEGEGEGMRVRATTWSNEVEGMRSRARAWGHGRGFGDTRVRA